MKKKTYLITGGTGFIGSAIIKKLVQSKVNVICFDSNIRGNFSKLGIAKNKVKIELGFEAFYVNTPRKYDAAGMTLGDPLVQMSRITLTSPYELGKLKLNQDLIHRQATCPSACTQDLNQTITIKQK